MRDIEFAGLHVDLTDGAVTKETLPGPVVAAFLGGRGLGIYFLAPFAAGPSGSSDIPLVFAAGPLCGTGIPGAGAISVISRSPLSGTLFDAEAVGAFPFHLRRAGYLYLRITGVSRRPVCLTIENDSVSLSPDPWRPGEGEPGRGWRGGVASIGTSALSRCRYASILFGGDRSPGRGGLGNIMAEKGLYRIRVLGNGDVPVADRRELFLAREQIRRSVTASPSLSGPYGIARYGTATLLDLIASRRMLPTRNFRSTFFEECRALSATAVDRTYGITGTGCGDGDGAPKDCPLLCRKVSRDGVPLPEADALAHFGALNGNADLDSVILANALCAEAGMDPVSAAATIACFAEITGRDIPSGEMPALLRKIADRREEGDLLAEGAARTADFLGSPGLSMSVKKMELPALDPRGAYGVALGYATSTRGACRMQSASFVHEVLRRPVATDRFSFAGKGRVVKVSEDLVAVLDSLSVCRLSALGSSLEGYARAFRAVTGFPKEAEDLHRDGERICLSERLFNHRAGFTRADDDLPARFFSLPGTSGDGIDIPPIDRGAFEAALSRYYANRGCDGTGMPLPETLAEFGLGGGKTP
jgi:aldehyde:ferredoxin oxidoreductase